MRQTKNRSMTDPVSQPGRDGLMKSDYGKDYEADDSAPEVCSLLSAAACSARRAAGLTAASGSAITDGTVGCARGSRPKGT